MSESSGFEPGLPLHAASATNGPLGPVSMSHWTFVIGW